MTEITSPTEDNTPAKNTVSLGKSSKLGLVVSFLAIGVSFYAVYLNQQNKITLGNQQEQLHRSIQNLAQSQTALSSELKGLTRNIDNLASKTDGAVNQTSTLKKTWYLDEALQTLQLANEQLQKNSDPILAELLVNKGIGLLKASGIVKWQPVADDLEQALLTFQTEYRRSLNDAMHTLDSLQNHTLELVIKEPRFTPGQSAPTEPTGDNPKLWRDKLKDSLNLLEKVIVIRKQDDSINPLLLPLYQKIVLESIRMNLQEAQWALLSHNTELYDQSLVQIHHEFERYTAPDAPANQDFAAKLQAAKNLDTQQSIKPFSLAVITALERLTQSGNTNNSKTISEDTPQ